jgi:hypothetical protein
MSNLFGLGVDNALQIRAVLPNGKLVATAWVPSSNSGQELT